MNLELTPNDVLYNFQLPELDVKDRLNRTPEFDEVYKKIKTAMEIDKEGYNVYLIDDFSKEKLKNIMEFIDSILKLRERPCDICYVVFDDEKSPRAIFLSNGKGYKLKETLEKIQAVYADSTFKFYNGSVSKDKDDIIQEIQRKRNELIGNLVDMAKVEGFDVKPTHSGFSFIPLKDGEAMTEKEYDDLQTDNKDDILIKVGALKSEAQIILERLKDVESDFVNRLKTIMAEYYRNEMQELKEEFAKEFENEAQAIEFLNYACENIEKDIVENYSTSYDDDEEKINETIYKFVVNVIVDNRSIEKPQVVFEEDPSVVNLLGSIEYENHNGNYVTDVSLISGGAFLRANEGCLVIRVSSLFNNTGAYYYLKKTLMSEKVKFDYNRGYLELLSLGGLRPEPITVKVKVILIGDYETYDLLYNYDEDFKNLFKIRAEYNPITDINDENKRIFIENVTKTVSENKLSPVSDEAIKEAAKYLSRKAGDRRKLLFDNNELSRLLILAHNTVISESREKIESRDVVNAAYSREEIEKEILENYKDKKILFNTSDKIVGSVNGLSVIDTGYFSFGKPLRITCTCYKGEGNITDVQLESNLSGNIHNKSINILKGYLNNILGGYNKICADFHLSFEQLYGRIDGDSASVAEIISIISALSRVPVRQNIAVTGSINQFGEVQPIGGVNEKIEGFYNVCKLKDGVAGRGVLIPLSNVVNLVLNTEVEDSIKNGDFKIYVMASVKDAVKVLMADEVHSVEDIFEIMPKELKKYSSKK